MTSRQGYRDDIEMSDVETCEIDSSNMSFGRTSRFWIVGMCLIAGSIIAKVSRSPDRYQFVKNENAMTFGTEDQIIPTTAPSRLIDKVIPGTEYEDTTTFSDYSSMEISTEEKKSKKRKHPKHPPKTYPDFSFYVMGDIPYNSDEEKLLKRQLTKISDDVESGIDDAAFIAHVGDLLDDSTTKCKEDVYDRVSAIMKENSVLPILPVPGNNDWDECPNPEQAHEYFNKYYIPLEEQWADTSELPSMVERSPKRQENFALFVDGIMFFGLHLMPRRNAELDEELGTERQEVLQDDFQWVHDYIDKYIHKLRVVIAFGHSGDGKDIAFHKVNRKLRHYGVSLFLFQGDEHLFKIRSNFGYPDDHDWNNCWRITVDQGGIARPLKVTVRGNEGESDHRFIAENEDQTVFDDIVKIDRRGGTYVIKNS